MNIVGIIPARMKASRFPGKPLAIIHDIPMIGHIYYRSKLCKILNTVYIATCDKSIEDYAKSINAPCVMTADTHERASDRVAEALLLIEKQTQNKIDIVVMIQGDEPMVHPNMIEESIKPFILNPEIKIVNLMSKLTLTSDFEDSNAVKVVTNLKSQAIYFSREPIPSRKKFNGQIPIFKQLGLIAFRRESLLEFTQLTETPLEIIESVDMMRVIEHGEKIQMVETQHKVLSVDTPEDLNRVIQAINHDILLKKYAQMRCINT